MRFCHILCRLLLALFLILIGIVYGVAAVGFTHPPSKEWGYMALALLCVKVGALLADERELPL